MPEKTQNCALSDYRKPVFTHKPERCHSPTAAMRRHLELEGTATAEVLADVASIPSGRVSALLKDDLKCGRVGFMEGYDGEKRVYRWNHQPVLTPTLRRAIEQLEELGYVVIAP